MRHSAEHLNYTSHLAPVNGSSDNSRGKRRSLKYILPITVSGVVSIVSACVIYTLYKRRKAKAPADNNAVHLYDQKAISYYEIVRATANLSEDNLLGRGSFGSVF